MPRLRKGSTGPHVVDLQTMLNEWLNDEWFEGRRTELNKLVVDGKFGDSTRYVLALWQQAMGQQPSGEVDFPIVPADTRGGGI